MAHHSDAILRGLTMATLGGLLFSAGLRLTWREIQASLRHTRLGWILPVNFLLVPALGFVLARLFHLPDEQAAGMMLLAAAPFAPVVPTFARLARADLALASALTGVFPVLSALLTPLVCELSLQPLLGAGKLRFDFAAILGILLATITLPLTAGVACSHLRPALGRRILRPVEVISEAAGTVALAFAIVTEFPSMKLIGWKSLLAMLLLSELSFAAGFASSGPAWPARAVVALGTANRNIALALLVAVASFPGSPIVGAVVANGLLLIVLGLLHVGVWRWRFSTPAAPIESPPRPR